MIPTKEPIQGSDYDSLIEIKTFAEIDSTMLDIRGSADVVNPKGETFCDLFNVAPMDYYGGGKYTQQYIGWLITGRNDTRYWVRISLFNMIEDYFARKYV